MREVLRDVMSPVTATVQPGDTLQTAARRILQSGENEVYVVDEQQRLLGVISDYEILKVQVAGLCVDALVEGFISRRIETYPPTFPVERLAGILRDGRHAHVPVVDDRRLVGRVHRRSVLRAMLESRESDRRIDSAAQTPEPAMHGSMSAAALPLQRRAEVG